MARVAKRCPNCKAVYKFPAPPAGGGAIHDGMNAAIAGVFECSCKRFVVLLWPGSPLVWFVRR